MTLSHAARQARHPAQARRSEQRPGPALRVHGAPPQPASFLDEVIEGLAARPRRIAPKFFYDERGSRLFDAICELPEYYLPRAEMRILESCADEIAALAGANATLIEIGSGASKKVRLLLESLRPRRYFGVDLSRDFLLESSGRLARDYPWLEVHAVCADFAREFELPGGAHAARKLVFFPGSTIGNFDPEEAGAFLRRMANLVQPDGAMLIGVDLKKDARRLHAAYNDSQGVTAEFNLNLLERMRTELGAELDPAGFRHCAFYDERRGRIEMHLVSVRAQEIRVGGRRFAFEPDETIHTENSYKYSVEEFQALALGAGARPERVWLDPERLFSVHYLSVGASA